MEENAAKPHQISRITQYVTTASATLGGLAAGTIIGFTTHCFHQLTSPTPRDFIWLTISQGSWFASSANLGAVLGGVVGGLAANRLGRRGTLLAVAPLFVGSWLLIAFAQNFAMLMVGRILTGLFMGVVCTTVPPYIAEFASADIRGTLGSWFQVMLTTGILYAFVFGAITGNWRIQAGICAIPPALMMVAIFFAKESPVFLVVQGKAEEAAESLQYYRGKDYPIQEELALLKDSLEAAKDNRLTLKDFRKPYILKPLLLSLALMFFQQTSGVPLVMFNLVSIFQESGSALSNDMSVIVIGIVQVFATCGGSILVDKVGRKKLLITSSAIMAASITGLGIYVKFRHSVFPVSSPIGVIPLILLIVFISSFSTGLGPIPWLMMGELPPPNAREATAGLSTAANLSFAFLVTLTYGPMKSIFRDHGLYNLCGSICLMSLLFSVFVVPETKGKTLQEISAHFGGDQENNNYE